VLADLALSSALGIAGMMVSAQANGGSLHLPQMARDMNVLLHHTLAFASPLAEFERLSRQDIAPESRFVHLREHALTQFQVDCCVGIA